jgi:hypothetical protein
MEQSNYKSIFPLSFEIKKISQKLYEKENIITSMTPEYMQIKTHGTLRNILYMTKRMQSRFS